MSRVRLLLGLQLSLRRPGICCCNAEVSMARLYDCRTLHEVLLVPVPSRDLLRRVGRIVGTKLWYAKMEVRC